MNRLCALVLLPHIQVRNANMISGPLSWGFPSITAFLGTAHALFKQERFPVTPAGVGVVCHHFEPQASRPAYTYALHLNRNPLDRDGSSASLVEEGRAHLEVSLVLGLAGELDDEEQCNDLTKKMYDAIQGMRIAGGSVQPNFRKPWGKLMPDALEEQNKTFRQEIRRRLLPGFVLTEQRDQLLNHLTEMRVQSPEATELDALLDVCRINWEPEQDPEDPGKAEWSPRRKKGWLVPVPVGYRGLSPLYEAGSVRNARDSTTPFRFVESVYTLGEWKSPHRLNGPHELLWHYWTDPEAGLYLCRQNTMDTEVAW